MHFEKKLPSSLQNCLFKKEAGKQAPSDHKFLKNIVCIHCSCRLHVFYYYAVLSICHLLRVGPLVVDVGTSLWHRAQASMRRYASLSFAHRVNFPME